MIKTILVGYPGSQLIRKKVEYLNQKYLPEFDITYLNYEGEIEGWSKYLADYLGGLTDKIVCFSLDDYLVNAPMDKVGLEQALALLKDDEVVCIKLCSNSEEELIGYSITTQYCLWKRDYLISILQQTTTPWSFEITGTNLHYAMRDKKVLLQTCVHYYTNSSLSSRWPGMNLKGLSEQDREEIKNL